MKRGISMAVVLMALAAVWPGTGRAVTREIAEMSPARFTFDQSVLNQLTYGTYRDPFDELQGRPYNLLFSSIGRHPNLSPWQGQAGNYTNYLNALIGNNGTANVDNDADSIQGSLVRRETGALAWGVAGAFLSGNEGSDDANATTAFTDVDDLSGFDLRGATAIQISDRRVIGAGIRVRSAGREVSDRSFEQGVGGFVGVDEFAQTSVTIDAGMRQFQNPTSSWEVRLAAGLGDATQDEFAVDLDDTGAVTARSVIADYDISELTLGVYGAYNRLKRAGLGETEFQVGLERTERELDNSDLAYTTTGGVVTPDLQLLGFDPVTSTLLQLSARSIFQAGETELFSGAQLGYGLLEGSSRVDAAGLVVNESIDDRQTHLGLTLGVRQPMFGEKIRFVISGRADLLSEETQTVFDTGSEREDSSLSTAQYAIGLEGVLANVTFDIAWLQGDEAPVVPVDLGLPGGSRRTVALDGLIFSAAVSW